VCHLEKSSNQKQDKGTQLSRNREQLIKWQKIGDQLPKLPLFYLTESDLMCFIFTSQKIQKPKNEHKLKLVADTRMSLHGSM
jgi:hypothetical protein